ncbi:uncharacterized protein LOC126549642 [Aphis gossypii]|uniref:uncharacterized protein LOC126549642 n=1 Tax=Aphis gossypii TaxID=80765 RepID=UPI002159114B|nr:uncharacterized protein LOC126549642 [Aphis gossypii]
MSHVSRVSGVLNNYMRNLINICEKKMVMKAPMIDQERKRRSIVPHREPIHQIIHCRDIGPRSIIVFDAPRVLVVMLFVRAESGGFEAAVSKSLSRVHPCTGWMIARGRLDGSGRRYISSQRTCGKKGGENPYSPHRTSSQ